MLGALCFPGEDNSGECWRGDGSGGPVGYPVLFLAEACADAVCTG